jgi:N-acetylglucosaminyldiphosphoundecaprenol N-acetyl-beta-D-mannosaminyltransferase
MSARANPQARDTLLQADCFVLDGVGLQWAAGMLGRRGLQRYPGVDLAFDLVRELTGFARSVYLLGAKPGIAERAAKSLAAQITGVSISGARDGYFSSSQDGAVAADIAAAQPTLLLVGMGSPRQEEFIVQNRATLKTPLMVGVGGSLEVFAGEKRRAPAWIQRLGMEWLYRSFQDFSRLKRLWSLARFAALTVGLVLRGERRRA